jgi:hypothetical protein
VRRGGREGGKRPADASYQVKRRGGERHTVKYCRVLFPTAPMICTLVQYSRQSLFLLSPLPLNEEDASRKSVPSLNLYKKQIKCALLSSIAA